VNRGEPATSGKVYLVGAGPGDPGLLTIKGRDCLASAEVVIYDYLANPALLAFAPDTAERIYAGKQAGQHTLTQTEINTLLVAYGRQGKVVVRLKGGDPFLFGRGSEEAEALRAAAYPLRSCARRQFRTGRSRLRRHPADPSRPGQHARHRHRPRRARQSRECAGLDRRWPPPIRWCY